MVLQMGVRRPGLSTIKGSWHRRHPWSDDAASAEGRGQQECTKEVHWTRAARAPLCQAEAHLSSPFHLLGGVARTTCQLAQCCKGRAQPVACGSESAQRLGQVLEQSPGFIRASAQKAAAAPKQGDQRHLGHHQRQKRASRDQCWSAGSRSRSICLCQKVMPCSRARHAP